MSSVFQRCVLVFQLLLLLLLSAAIASSPSQHIVLVCFASTVNVPVSAHNTYHCHDNVAQSGFKYLQGHTGIQSYIINTEISLQISTRYNSSIFLLFFFCNIKYVSRSTFKDILKLAHHEFKALISQEYSSFQDFSSCLPAGQLLTCPDLRKVSRLNDGHCSWMSSGALASRQ